MADYGNGRLSGLAQGGAQYDENGMPLSALADERTLGQTINYPGSTPNQGPGMWDKLWSYFFTPNTAQPVPAAPRPSATPGSGSPYVNPDTAKAISDYFNGKSKK